MIRVESVSRNYGAFKAVDSVSFEITKGQIVGLLGHNGAGKTTVMKMLTGYLEPDSGLVEIDGVNIESNRIHAQQRIGYLPENSPLYPDMSVIQYLEYVASLRAIPEELQKERIIEAVEKTALGAKANSLISTLSKGYKQRVGVAQAILHRPEILILDEPTNGLDPSQIQEMRSLVTTLSEGATVILSTHILQEVQATCDRVLIMLHGKLARDARLDELQSSNRLVLSVSGSEEDVVKNLVDLSGVSDVQFLGNGGPANQFAVATGDSTEELAPRLAKKVIESGWELYSLAPEQRNLETVFREINSGAGGN